MTRVVFGMNTKMRIKYMKLTNYIAEHHNGNINAFALAESYHVTQVKRYLAQGAEIENGRVYFKKYMVKKDQSND
jgi:hypothetical protein